MTSNAYSACPAPSQKQAAPAILSAPNAAAHGPQGVLELKSFEGKAEGKAEVLLRLLELKFGAVPEPAAARIRSASLSDVDRWIERVITATTLESVLAD